MPSLCEDVPETGGLFGITCSKHQSLYQLGGGCPYQFLLSVNFQHKYRPGQIRELNEQLKDTSDKAKNLRAYLVSILKDIHPSQDYCIRIWDPEGEENRRREEQLKKIQEEEIRQQKLERKRQLKLEIEEKNRKAAEKLRMKMEDEAERKRKEAAIQAQLQAEKDARLKYARENVKFVMESKEDIALRNRLEQASRLEREVRERAD